MKQEFEVKLLIKESYIYYDGNLVYSATDALSGDLYLAYSKGVLTETEEHFFAVKIVAKNIDILLDEKPLEGLLNKTVDVYSWVKNHSDYLFDYTIYYNESGIYKQVMVPTSFEKLVSEAVIPASGILLEA